jgi:RNA polymerase sigma-70 factor (ECF subfamily)
VRADTYEPNLGCPAAWLARIARNCAIDRTRAKKARQSIDAPRSERDEAGPEPSTAITPEVVLEDRTKSVVVRGALESLPMTQRTLIEAAFFEGYTHQELSARFGVPLGTVKGRIRTGLLALRTQLAQAV